MGFASVLRGLCAAFIASAFASSALAESDAIIVSSTYAEPTKRYPHGVLGDDIEWGALRFNLKDCATCDKNEITRVTLRLPESRVFEDTEPRLIDLYGQGENTAVVVVESDARLGARLAIYDAAGVIAATPFIGMRNRWLAPIGVADMDGDGRLEFAYIDRPHLAKVLRLWRFDPDRQMLKQIAQSPGLTNHRIGETDIAGGLRTCMGTTEMIVATGDWSRLIAVRFQDERLVPRDIGAHKGRASFAAAMACR
ncbi:MAG: VCBS repeat-containing protein [Pseudomonadota bacterium]